jgi:predicted ATP-grasp superfamily ATP-dependent carboligase
MNPPPIVIAVGYSVRSLVAACSRAGLDCIAVDHFGDWDTREFAKGRWIQLELIDERFLAPGTMSAIEQIVSSSSEGNSFAFLLGGGMENLGEAVEQLRSIGTVLGPSESQRSQLRDWKFLQSAASAAGIGFPKTHTAEDTNDTYNSLDFESGLWKPLRGAGGLKIVRAEKNNATRDQGYWQRYIAGRQLGVACAVHTQGCRVIGATQSLAATDWPGPSEFIYRGSLGPVPLTDDAHGQVKRLCELLQQQLDYTGLLQFDFIQDADGRLWLLECNPRWTAGMEVLFGHCENCEHACELIDGVFLSISRIEQNAAVGRESPGNFNRTFAKAIVYAQQEIHLTEHLVHQLQRQSQGDTSSFTWLADLPYAAQTIERGHPIATVRTSVDESLNIRCEADTHSQLLLKLRSCADRLYALTGC